MIRFVKYTLKNELGLVKGPNNTGGYFVWYHLGDTASSTPLDIIEPLESVEEILNPKFSNEYAKFSLMERYLRLLEGGDVSDLIDERHIRPGIMNQFIKHFDYEKERNK